MLFPDFTGRILNFLSFSLDMFADEFVVFVSGMPEKEVQKRVKSLYDRAEKEEHLHFAVGTSAVSEGEGVLKAMHLADKRMYADKREYYKKHPDKVYR